MVVRIRVKGRSADRSRESRVPADRDAAVSAKPGIHRSLAVAVAALLTPSALMSCVLALWRLGADLQIAGEFAIEDGLFSKWQVWIVLALILQVCAWRLNRYASPEDGREPTL